MSFHRTVSLALLIPINQGLFKNEQTPVVPKVDSAIGYRNTYPLDGDLSSRIALSNF